MISMVLTWDQDPTELYGGIKIADTVQRLIRERLTAHTDELRSREHEFPTANIRALADEGLLGMKTPREYGGLGLDTLNVTYAVEQIARVAPATAFVLLLHTLTVNRLAKAGTDGQKKKYLPRISCETLGASAWSESGVGADKAILNTKAYCEDGVWHLNGQKAFCTGAGHAGVYMVMTDTTEGKGFFLVADDNPGLRIGEPMDSMGLQGTHSGAVSLDDARVPDADRVGEPGKIGPIINFDMQAGLHSGIVATGIALGAFGRLLDIVKANNSFDKYESVRVRVSQLAATLSVMRTYVYSLAQMASLPDDDAPGDGGGDDDGETVPVGERLADDHGRHRHRRQGGLSSGERPGAPAPGRPGHRHRRPHQRSGSGQHRRVPARPRPLLASVQGVIPDRPRPQSPPPQ